MSLSKLSLSPFSPPSSTLAHVNRVLSSCSGQDKVFMLMAYGAKVLDFGLRHPSVSTKSRRDLAERVSKLGALIGDARVLYRLFGLFPILQWAQSLNDPASAPKDKWLKVIQRVQVWSMLVYYPLEHYYYLAGKGVFKASAKKISDIAIWSCRFWAAYVALQVAHNLRSRALLTRARVALAQSRKTKLQAGESVTKEDVEEEKREIKRIEKEQEGLRRDAWVQAGYLPLTMHWSLPNGLLPDPVYVGLCGSLAAVHGLIGVWKGTA
ncbi:peroxisomal biogenesis factor 11 [Leucosporidium creatinivorum]|uniref:Peroxisomal biogenesis factor 11 n=1 Tax=Leucosporidium creatinivorum TaxID=106004 RepID=A0A1Y2FPV4_9BASI|nr:peroxisomal biogenesis factor 11 [Leucosporidium creatinivorum]